MNVSTKRVNPFISWCVFHLQYLLVAVCVIMTIAEILFFPSAGVMTFFLVCVHVFSCCPDAAAADYMLQYHFFYFCDLLSYSR